MDEHINQHIKKASMQRDLNNFSKELSQKGV